MTLTELIHQAHDKVRAVVRSLDPKTRGKLWRPHGIIETHFYAWLRGNDHSISTASIDLILQDISDGFSLRLKSKKGRPSREWDSVDWKKTDRQLAVELGLAAKTVYLARWKKFGRTQKKWTPKMISELRAKGKGFAKRHGLSASSVSAARRRYGIPAHYLRRAAR